MGLLAEGRLDERVPQELVALAGWLKEELDPAAALAGSDGSDREYADALVQLALRQQWVIRSVEAGHIRTLAQAARVMPPARRRAPHRAGEGQDADGTSAAASTGDGAARISAQRLTSSRIAPELNCHPRSATVLLEHACGLVDDLPVIMGLFEQARLDRTRAITVTRMLHQAAEEIEDFAPGTESWRLMEAMIAAQAPGLTNRDLERLIARLVLTLQPDGGEQAHEQAFRSRQVTFEALEDGMSAIYAIVPADIAQLLNGFLDAAADAERDRSQESGVPDPRTHAQRCADILAALVRAVTNGMDIPLAGISNSDAGAGEVAGGGGDAGGGHDLGESVDTHVRAGGPADPETDGSTPSCPPAPVPDPSQGPDPVCVPASLRRPVAALGPAAGHAAGAGARRVEGLPSTPASVIEAWRQILALHGAAGGRTHLNVTITDASLLGLDTAPALLHGHGPVAASLARRLAVKPSQVTVIVLPNACTHADAHDPAISGTVPGLRAGRSPANANNAAEAAGEFCPVGLDHTLPGINRYRPGRVLTTALVALYPTCTFPGCTTPAARCDLDHLKPFERGGHTCICNMRPACRGHHRLKTFGDWHARASRPEEPYPFGSTIWTAPDGVTHHTPPPCLPGMPGWTLPTTQPRSEPRSRSEPDRSLLSRVDRMPAEERTARRTRTWKDDIAWLGKRKAELRQEAERRLGENPPPVPRPPHATWGEGRGHAAGLGEPPF